MYHVRQAIAIENDTRKRKKVILIVNGVLIVLCITFASLYLTRYSDVGTMEDHREEIKKGYGFKTEPEEAIVYDQFCLEYGHNKESGEYQDLVDEIAGQIRSQEDI